MIDKKDEIMRKIILERCKTCGLGMYLKVLAICAIYLTIIKIKKHWLFITMCALAILILKIRFGA